jgi:hypothetical protein
LSFEKARNEGKGLIDDVRAEMEMLKGKLNRLQ